MSDDAEARRIAQRRVQQATGCNWCGYEWGEADASRCPECGHSDLRTVNQSTGRELICVGCNRLAPASAEPEECGNWLCQPCTKGMKRAMRWMEAISGKR